jgi:hypothetical protein
VDSSFVIKTELDFGVVSNEPSVTFPAGTLRAVVIELAFVVTLGAAAVAAVSFVSNDPRFNDGM